jgi:hypothetical protein
MKHPKSLHGLVTQLLKNNQNGGQTIVSSVHFEKGSRPPNEAAHRIREGGRRVRQETGFRTLLGETFGHSQRANAATYGT